MKRLALISLCLTALSFSAGSNAEPAASHFTPEQKNELSEIIHKYLMDNPTLVQQMNEQAHRQNAEKAQVQAEAKITTHIEELISSGSPSVGSPDAEIVIVEFLDYQCGYCKRMHSVMDEVLAKNPNVRVIYKSFAVLGPNSILASKAAMASEKQNKFKEFHKALLENEAPLDQPKLMQIAESAGLNIQKLQLDMKLPEMDKKVLANAELAKKIGIEGTPAFILASKPQTPEMKVQLIPGAADEATFQDFINKKI